MAKINEKFLPLRKVKLVQNQDFSKLQSYSIQNIDNLMEKV